MGRWTSRDALLRVALVGALGAFYWSPDSFFGGTRGSASASASGSNNGSASAAQRVVELRLWLTLLITVVALVGVISTPLVIVSCAHAALHVAQSLLRIELCAPAVSPWCWRAHGLATTAYEWGSVATFVLMLRYVLLPPPSILATTRRHSRQLKRFFQQHDKKYVSLVDRLLDDYTGNERLLFARIRKIYRAKPLSPS